MLRTPIPTALRLDHRVEPALNRYQRFGIELEYEQLQGNVALRGMPWTAVRDGSLREGGVEFVSHPLKFRDVGPALSSIMRKAARMGARATPRCGLHVHINMRPYTVGQVLSLAVVYGLVEPAVFRKFAEGRDLSPFCVPQYANTVLIQGLTDDVVRARQEGHRDLAATIGSNKYSALNYSSLPRFGTVEARQLHCTLDPQEARVWVEFWKRVVDYAVQFDDPLQVMDEYERAGLQALHELLLGEVVEVDPLDQEDADDSCLLIAGAAEAGNMGLGGPVEDEPPEFDEFLDEMDEPMEEWA